MITSEDYSEDKIKLQSASTLVTSILLAKLCGKFSIIYLLCDEFLFTQIMLTVIAMQTEDLYGMSDLANLCNEVASTYRSLAYLASLQLRLNLKPTTHYIT